MTLAVDWIALREWGGFALAAATLGLVAYDLWWVRRPRLRADLRTYRDSDRLDLRIVNLGGGPASITEVLIQHSGKGPVNWAPGPDTLPAMVHGLGAVEWRIDLEHAGGGAHARLVIRTTAGDRAFEIPAPGAPVRGVKGARWS